MKAKTTYPEKNINQTVSENIKKLRNEKGLAQEQLANDLNLSETILCRIEKEKRPVQLEELHKFSDYFGVSISYLCGESDQRNIDIKSDGEDFMYQVMTFGLDKLDINARKRVLQKLRSRYKC